MTDWKITKGPIDLDELEAYLQDLSDIRNKADFPTLIFREEELIVTDLLPKFAGKHRMVTVDSKGRQEYRSHWQKLGTRPDAIVWGGMPYIVYSITKIVGEDALYLTIGSKPSERIMIRFDKDTVIIRDHTRLSGKPKWIIKYAKQVSYQTKWD